MSNGDKERSTIPGGERTKCPLFPGGKRRVRGQEELQSHVRAHGSREGTKTEAKWEQILLPVHMLFPVHFAGVTLLCGNVLCKEPNELKSVWGTMLDRRGWWMLIKFFNWCGETGGLKEFHGESSFNVINYLLICRLCKESFLIFNLPKNPDSLRLLLLNYSRKN